MPLLIATYANCLFTQLRCRTVTSSLWSPAKMTCICATSISNASAVSCHMLCHVVSYSSIVAGIVNTEFVMDSVLKQEIDFEPYLFRREAKTETASNSPATSTSTSR